MANGDPVELPNLQDPQAILSRRRMARTGSEQEQPLTRKQAQTSPGSTLDGIVGIYGNEPDPGMRSIMKALVETEISRAMGFNVNLPDPEDVERNALVAQRENMRLTREIAKETVDFAKAAILDIPKDSDIGMTMRDTDLDSLLESDPDKAIAVMNKLGFPVTRGMLSLAGEKDTDTASAGPAFQAKQAEEQAKGLSTQAGAIESAKKIAKEGPEVFDTGADAAFKSAGEALGVDVDPFFGNPLSSDKGALAFMDATQQIGRKGPAFAGKTAEALISRNADDIADALEDMPVTKDGLLQIVPGKGEAQRANSLYVALGVLKASQLSGTNITDLFSQIPDLADKAVGFDMESVKQAAGAELDRLGEGGEQLRGFLESL